MAAPKTIPTFTVTPGDGRIKVEFSLLSETPPVREYIVTVKNSAGTVVKQEKGSGSPIEVDGLTNGTTYCVTIRAKNTAGEKGSDGIAQSATPTPVTPPAPTPQEATLTLPPVRIPLTAGGIQIQIGGTPPMSTSQRPAPTTAAANRGALAWIIGILAIMTLATIATLVVFKTINGDVAQDDVTMTLSPEGLKWHSPRNPGIFTKGQVKYLIEPACSLATQQARYQQMIDSLKLILRHELDTRVEKQKIVELQTLQRQIQLAEAAANAARREARRTRQAMEEFTPAPTASQPQPAPTPVAKATEGTFVLAVENKSPYTIRIRTDKIAGSWKIKPGGEVLLSPLPRAEDITVTAEYLDACGRTIATHSQTTPASLFDNGRLQKTPAGRFVDAETEFGWNN